MKKSGIEEKIQELLDATSLDRYLDLEKKLLWQMQFYSDHKLDEELRIARLKYDTISLLLYEHKKLIEDLQEALDKWNS